LWRLAKFVFNADEIDEKKTDATFDSSDEIYTPHSGIVMRKRYVIFGKTG
jgi:hypothetical protein